MRDIYTKKNCILFHILIFCRINSRLDIIANCFVIGVFIQFIIIFLILFRSKFTLTYIDHV